MCVYVIHVYKTTSVEKKYSNTACMKCDLMYVLFLPADKMKVQFFYSLLLEIVCKLLDFHTKIVCTVVC